MPTTGTMKVFPNGRHGVWDGQGWKDQGGETDTPSTAVGNSIADTVKQTGSGIVEGFNPLNAISDLIKGIPGRAQMLMHPFDTTTETLKSTPNALRGMASLGDPRTGGNAIGNLLLGLVTGRVLPKIPGVVSRVSNAAGTIGTAAADVAEELPLIGKPIAKIRDVMPGVTDAMRSLKEPETPHDYSGPRPVANPEGTGRVPRPGTMSPDVPSGTSNIKADLKDPVDWSQYMTDKPTAPSASEPSVFKQMDSNGAFGGDRSTGHFQEGSGGLSDVAAGKIKPYDAPMNGLRGESPNIGNDITETRGMSEPDVPNYTYEGSTASNVNEQVPGLSIGSEDQLHPGYVPPDLPRPVPPSSTPDFELPPGAREIPRADEMWGPNAIDAQGQPAQAPGQANLKVAPQISNDELRQLMKTDPTPEGRAFYTKAYAQRSIINRAMAGLQQPQ